MENKANCINCGAPTIPSEPKCNHCGTYHSKAPEKQILRAPKPPLQFAAEENGDMYKPSTMSKFAMFAVVTLGIICGLFFASRMNKYI